MKSLNCYTKTQSVSIPQKTKDEMNEIISNISLQTVLKLEYYQDGLLTRGLLGSEIVLEKSLVEGYRVEDIKEIIDRDCHDNSVLVSEYMLHSKKDDNIFAIRSLRRIKKKVRLSSSELHVFFYLYVEDEFLELQIESGKDWIMIDIEEQFYHEIDKQIALSDIARDFLYRKKYKFESESQWIEPVSQIKNEIEDLIVQSIFLEMLQQSDTESISLLEKNFQIMQEGRAEYKLECSFSRTQDEKKSYSFFSSKGQRPSIIRGDVRLPVNKYSLNVKLFKLDECMYNKEHVFYYHAYEDWTTIPKSYIDDLFKNGIFE